MDVGEQGGGAAREEVASSTENEVASFVDWLGVTEPVDRRQLLGAIGKSMLVLGAMGGLGSLLDAHASAASVLKPTMPAAGSKTYRVAFIIWINNPYWQETALQISKILKPRLAKQGVSIDMVNAGATASAVDVSSAINDAISEGYNGLIVAGVAPSMAPVIAKAKAKGIPVFTFCCDVPDSDRVAFYGPDNYSIGRDAAKLMVQGLKEQKIMAKRNLKSGVIGIETALGVSSLVDRSNGFRDEWKVIGPKNITLLEYLDAEDEAALVYSKARDAISSYPELVGLYVACGSQYALGDAIIEAKKVGQVVGVAHEVFQPTLLVMQKGGLWGVTNDAPIGQVIPPGDAMSALLRTGKKPAAQLNDSAKFVSKYWVYASDTAWIDQELKDWKQLTNDCKNGCPDLVKREMPKLPVA